jgi:hypothetical protein
MKCLITGLIILISGIFLSVQNANERYDKKTGETKKRNIGMYIYPYLIPVGVSIATAGIGGIMQRNGEKKSRKYKSMYYKTARKKSWHFFDKKKLLKHDCLFKI